jgi:hypothetical protein
MASSRSVFRNICLLNRPGVRNRSTTAVITDVGVESTKPYDEVPGPKPLPVFGNTWRMLPVIGI